MHDGFDRRVVAALATPPSSQSPSLLPLAPFLDLVAAEAPELSEQQAVAAFRQAAEAEDAAAEEAGAMMGGQAEALGVGGAQRQRPRAARVGRAVG